MRCARILALGVVLSSCTCVYSAPPPPLLPAADIETLRAETVGLVSESGLCSGVWVSPRVVLTAAHCTDQPLVVVNYEPSAAAMMGHDSELLARDEAQDLALLAVDGDEEHPVAALGPNVATGAMVHVVGHTGGLGWSYSPGFVSGVRDIPNGPDGVHGSFLQMWGGVWKGNSGGGAFDASGRLVGICSFLRTEGNLSFFVSRDAIAKFLGEHHVS